MRKIYLLLVTMIAISVSVMAAPLRNVNVTLTQPDGQVIHCFASGDEFYNYLHDENGFTIVIDDKGYYCYATKDAKGEVIASNFVVGSVDPASVGLQPYTKISEQEYYVRRHEREKHIQRPQVRNGRELNHGLYNNLVVFIRFAGDTYHTSPFSTVEAMFNADGYDDNSLHNYYHHTSYNQLDLWSHFFPQPEGETILSYEDIYPKQYYQPYHPVTNPMGYQDGETAEREFSMLERAIQYIEDMVPYDIDLDYNGDGLVDNVVFVIKGEPGEWASLLWPHRWCIYDRDVPLHDLKVYDFNLQLEEGGYFNVSTLCHEMFHSLGAPDLYHYSEGIDPVGPWDLMCGTTEPPQQTSTYMKYKYGNWVDEIPMLDEPSLNTPHTYELEAVSWEGGLRNGYMLPTGYPNQFFFIEYRDKNNIFENKIPGSGLLIYRIDTRFDGNASWNGYDYFDEVYLFRPGGSIYSVGELNQAFFTEEYGRVRFNNATEPHPFLNQYPNYQWPYEITNIRTIGDRMSFDFLPYEGEGGGSLLENFTANVNSLEHQVELSWDANPNADFYKVYCDGEEIAENITDTTFVYPYTDTDAGYHIFSVLYVSGEQLLHSAPSFAWVILGNYETIQLHLSCDPPYGTKGGELEVCFNNPLMSNQYLTIYRDTENETEVYVPANIEAGFRWKPGFDTESQGIHVTATRVNESGVETLFDIDQPQEGILATYTASDSEIGVIAPQNITTTSTADEVNIHWTVPTESHHFNVYRNGTCLASSLTDYEFTDDRIAQSGTFRYHVTNAFNPNTTLDPEKALLVLVMTFACEPPQNLQGEHHAGAQPYNELTWEAPQFMGHGMLAYDDGKFEDQMGSKNQKFGIKIDPDRLTYFEGLPLTHIEMFDCSAGTYTYKIYNGDNVVDDNLLYSQAHEMTGSQTFVRFPLDEEVSFDSTLPLWIVAEPSNVENPVPYGAYVGYDNSCMVRVSGNWRPITHYDKYYSWLLRAYTRPADSRPDFSYKVYVGPEEANDYEMNIGFQDLTATHLTHDTNENTRYNVTAIWNGKETIFSNTVILGPSVAVTEQHDNKQVTVYPNPAKDHLTIKATGLSQVTVMNLLGQELERINVTGDETILNLSHYDPALYLLRIVTENGTFVEHIVKEL